jgi:hypothetical protein
MFEFGHLFKPEAYKSEGMATGVMEKLDELLKLYDRSMAKITLIHRNTGLTAVGKVTAFKELKAELAKELAGWSKSISGYSEQIKRIEAEAHPTRHPKDDVAHENRAREIRDHLRGLDPTDAEAEFMSAAEAGNSELVQAILYAPVRFKFATADLVAKVSRQQWEREFPADASKLRDLQAAHGETTSALNSVRADLRKAGLEVRAEDLGTAEAA